MGQIGSCDVKFEVQNNYIIEDFADFWLGLRWKSPGKAPPKQVSPRSMRALSWVMIFAGVMIEIAYLWLKPITDLPYFKYAWIFCVVGIIALIRGVPQYPHWVQKAWKNYQKQQWAYFIVRFTQENFQLCFSNQSGNSDCHYSYSFIHQLWEDEGHFYIGVSSNEIYMLQKPGFIQGDPSDFPGFLKEKTGKLIQWVNGDRPH